MLVSIMLCDMEMQSNLTDLIIITIKSIFQEGYTISTKLISLVALRYLKFYKQIRAY